MDGMQKDKKAGGWTVKISFIEEGPDGSFLSFLYQITPRLLSRIGH